MIFRRPEPRLRPAAPEDREPLAELIALSHHVHKHLDWRPALDWLDSEPFLVLSRGQTLLGALGCAPDPPEVAWLRLFVVHPQLDPERAWQMLYPAARAALGPAGRTRMCAVALHPWISRLLKTAGFIHHQDIVCLDWTHPDAHPWENPPAWENPPGCQIRPMALQDLDAVTQIDQAAFEDLWRNTREDVERAYAQSNYASVVADDSGTILGFQISTSNGNYAHLARLAVRPDCQARGLGLALVREMLHCQSCEAMRIVTVNTQSTNQTSLALYQKAGFVPTGETFPVWVEPVPPYRGEPVTTHPEETP